MQPLLTTNTSRRCAGWHWVTWHEIEMLSKSRLFVPVINLIHSGFQPATRVGD